MWWTGKKLFLLLLDNIRWKPTLSKKFLDQRTAKYKNKYKYKYKPWASRFLINALPALRMILCPRTSLPSSHTKKNILYIYWIHKIYYFNYIHCILYIYYRSIICIIYIIIYLYDSARGQACHPHIPRRIYLIYWIKWVTCSIT